MSAAVAQNAPALHGVHCAVAERPETFENVPTGQGTAVPSEELAGHAYPAGHVAGVTVPPLQNIEEGHVAQTEADDEDWNVPPGHASGAALPPVHRLPAGHAMPLALLPPGQY